MEGLLDFAYTGVSAIGNDLSESSRKTYIANAKRLLKYFGNSAKLSEVLCNPVYVMEALDRTPLSLNSRANLVNTMCAILRHSERAQTTAYQALRPQWQAIADSLSGELKTIARESGKSARENAAWITPEEINGKLKQLAKDEFGSQRHLLLALFALLPPVRGGDYGHVYIATAANEDDGKGNVLLLNLRDETADLVIRLHKTAKTYGAIGGKLPRTLYDIVVSSLAQKPRSWLFVKSDSGPFTSEQTFNKWANNEFFSIFGKHVTANIFRHVFSSETFRSGKMSYGEVADRAAALGHSVEKHLSYMR